MKRFFEATSRLLGGVGVVMLMVGVGDRMLRAEATSIFGQTCSPQIGTNLCAGNFFACPFGMFCKVGSLPTGTPSHPDCCE